MNLNEVLIIERHGSVAVVRLNRPAQHNAVDERLHSALASLWQELGEDRDIRAVVITGVGRAFCAGGDASLLSLMTGDEKVRDAMVAEGRTIFEGQVRLSIPVIAAVNGPAAGLGASLAILSDFVLMAEGSYLVDPHIQIGMIPADGGVQAWPLVMGLHRAKKFLLLGERLSADEALELGLATEIVPPSELFDRALELATKVAELPADAVRTAKEALNMHLFGGPAAAHEHAFSQQQTVLTSPETSQALAALGAKLAAGERR